MAESQTINHSNVTAKSSRLLALVSIIGGNLLVAMILLLLYVLY